MVVIQSIQVGMKGGMEAVVSHQSCHSHMAVPEDSPGGKVFVDKKEEGGGLVKTTSPTTRAGCVEMLEKAGADSKGG